MKGQAGEVSHQPSLRHVLALEGVGLITVERTDGRAARVTLLDEPSVGLRRRRSGYLRLISLGADEERVSAARRGLRSGDHLARAPVLTLPRWQEVGGPLPLVTCDLTNLSACHDHRDGLPTFR
jgi:hypothetical protein